MADKLTDRQTDRKKERWLVGSILHLVASADAYFNGWLNRGRQTDIHRERDRQIDRQTDREKERQIDTQTGR